MKIQKLLQAGALSAALGLASSAVHAIAVTDVTFGIPPGAYQNADAAELLSGNDSPADLNSLSGAFAGDAWSLLDKTDSAATEFQGVTFTLNALENATAGSWSLEWEETGTPGLPLSLDLVFVTKAGSQWGAYLFESLDFTSFPSSGDGTFEISWLTNGGSTPGLSHASIYGRIGVQDPDPKPRPVPVPGTLLLLSVGLLGLRWGRGR